MDVLYSSMLLINSLFDLTALVDLAALVDCRKKEKEKKEKKDFFNNASHISPSKCKGASERRPKQV